jgi:hypothetical protein
VPESKPVPKPEAASTPEPNLAPASASAPEPVAPVEAK